MMANAVFTKELIFERIKDSGYPFWSLGLQQGFKNVSNVMQYYGNDFEETDTDETKIQKSISKLDNIVSSFPPDSIFVIEIKNGKQANGSGIIGPFQFTAIKQESPQQQLNGIPAGYVPESLLKGIEEKLQSQFDTKLENFKLESERKARELEFERRAKELDEREERLKELEKGYNSDVAKSADVLLRAGKSILEYMFPDMPKATATAQPSLHGVESSAQVEEQDEKSKVIDNLAEYLYENFTPEAITKLHNNLKTIRENEKTKSDLQNENTTA